MSAPYLNRGESIILTTHRMSVDAVEYDAILTTGRLILMDNRYTGVEPRIIPLPLVITMKGGKTPAGDPAIILTLEEPDTHGGPDKVSLVFSQEPGEQRKEEREVWVKKMIELTISAREQSVRETIIPARKKTGMQPTVRRFEAPETPRPHTSAREPGAVRPETADVVEDPESQSFSADRIPAPVSSRGAGIPEIIRGSVLNIPDVPENLLEPAESQDIHKEKKITKKPHKKSRADIPAPVAWPVIRPSPVMDQGVTETQAPTVSEIAGEAAGENASAPLSASTVSSVLESFRIGNSRQDPGPAEIPGHQKISQPADAKPVEIPASTETPEPEPVKEIRIQSPQGVPVPACDEPTVNIPETPAQPPTPHKGPAKTAPGRRSIGLTVLLLIAALLVLSGGILLATHYLQGNDTGNVIVTPVPTVTQASIPVSVAPHEGVRVNVIYPYDYFGTVGNPERLHHVSGTGNQTFPVLMTSDIVQATIQKQDNSIEALTIEIYTNSTLVSTKTVTSPMGEASILIDMKTGRSPGMTVDTPSADNRTLLGNGSLIYY